MSIHERKRLSDILNEREREHLARQFQEAEAAADSTPIPPGRYRCRLTSGDAVQSKAGTPGYRLTFTVEEGEHEGRRVWHTCWFTPAAFKYSKRDLAKLGVQDLSRLDVPLSQGFICDVTVALRTDDAGLEWNSVTRFEVIEVLEDPMADPDFGSAGANPSEEMPF